MSKWYNEFRTHCESTPCILVGNKIDLEKKSTERKYNLAEQIKCPFHLVSAADGTNVVRIFEDLILLGLDYKQNSSDYFGSVMRLLENDDLFDA